MAERVDVANLFSKLYLPETTFATVAVRIDGKTAEVTHTLTEAQCDPQKTSMLRGEIEINGNVVTNARNVDNIITEGHFKDLRLLAGHQGFGMLLAAGSYDNPMWWTAADLVTFQSPAVLEDEMSAIASIIQDDNLGRVISGKVVRGAKIHTRARKILLEPAQTGYFNQPHLPQNAWLEVAAHFGGGAIAALGEFPQGDYAPIYLGIGESRLPKELALPEDRLLGKVTLNSIEHIKIPNLGSLKVVSVDETISKGPSVWRFNQVEFGFMPREQLIEAIRQR